MFEVPRRSFPVDLASPGRQWRLCGFVVGKMRVEDAVAERKHDIVRHVAAGKDARIEVQPEIGSARALDQSQHALPELTQR